MMHHICPPFLQFLSQLILELDHKTLANSSFHQKQGASNIPRHDHCLQENEQRINFNLSKQEANETSSTFSTQTFIKHQFSAVARKLLNLNIHCRAVFSCLDEKDIHLVGQCYHIHLLKVNDIC